MGEFLFAGFHLAALAVCLALAIVDLRERRLPNKQVLALLVVALSAGFVGVAAGADLDHVGNAAIGTIAFGGPCLIVNLISPRQMGFGDVKLALVLGLFIGWHNPRVGISTLFGAFVLALPQALWRIVADRRGGSLGREFAFGPYLIAAAAISVALNYASP